MRKVLGSISLLVLLLNTLLTPITYAGEYEEILETSGENVTEEVVEENGEEESSSEFSVEEENNDEENEEEKTEEEEEGTEETEDDETTTGDVVEEGTGDIVEEGTGEVEELTGEIAEILTGTVMEEFIGYIEELTGGVIADEEIGTGESEEIEYNKESIIGERTYNDVTVKVEALSGIFPEGTKLKIEPIRWWNLSNLKDKLVEEQEEVKEDTTVVAFDITFTYSGEEVQPKEGEKVKVTFDYSKNEELVEADKQENQEVKVYHIEDKDEEGNELEEEERKIKDVTNKEESEESGIAVAEGEKFSVYAIVKTSGNGLRVTYNLNGGYWTEDHSYNPKTAIYTGTKTTMRYRTPSKTGFMFMGWYFTGLTNRREDGEVTDGMDVYAKWQEFGDLDIYIIKNENTIPAHYTFMDRNMGATEIYNKVYNDSTKTNYASYGYYYQFGNNYGFPSYMENTGTISNQKGGKENISLYSWDKPYSSPTFAGVGQEDWISTNSLNIWGGNQDDVSRRQGPCPDGYHVPTQTERTTVVNARKDGNSRGNTFFHEDFLLPAASYRSRQTKDAMVATKVYEPDFKHHRYLSSTASSNRAYLLKIESNSTIKTNETDKSANGFSVRCIKNEENSALKAIDKTNIHINGGEKAIISIASGEVVSLQEPTKDGKVFGGWYTNSAFSGNKIDIGSGIEAGSGLYARWICDEGKVENDEGVCVMGSYITFDANGGTVDQNSKKVIYGETYYNDLPIPIRDEYLFKGWYANFNGTSDFINYGKHYKYTDKISIHVSAYMDNWSTYSNNNYRFISSTENGGWAIEPKNSKIHFIARDGGTYKEATSERYWSSLLPGWHDFDMIFDGTYFYGYLDGEEITRTSEFSNGEINYHGSNSIFVGAEAGGSATEPYGKYFNGKIKNVIILNSDELISSGDAFNSITAPNQNITLYAEREPVKYSINYILNGGSVSEQNQTGYTIETTTFTLNNPTKEGPDFEGWSGTDLPICSQDDLSNCSKTVTIQQGSTGDRTYEAIWGQMEYNLNFDSLGGTDVPTQIIIEGKTGTRPENPTKDGYEFDGWYYTGLQTEFDFETPITSDITIYAKWGGDNNTVLLPGQEFNKKIKSIANGTTVNYIETVDTYIFDIQRYKGSTPNLSNAQEIQESGDPVYAWFDNGTLYYYSNAEEIYINPDATKMFYKLDSLTGFDFTELETSEIQDMTYMFGYDTNLITLNMSQKDFRNVTNITNLLNSCSNLKDVDMHSVVFEKLISFEKIFLDRVNLESVNLTNANLGKAENLKYMFFNTALKTVQFENMTAEYALDIGSMFHNCSHIETVNMRNLDMRRLPSTNRLFIDNPSIKNVDMTNINLSGATDIGLMFFNCGSLKEVNMTNANLRSVTSIDRMFQNSKNLRKVNLTNVDLRSLGSMASMFMDNSYIEEVNLEGVNASSIKSTKYMFYNATNLKKVNFKNMDVSSLTGMEMMFQKASSLTGLELNFKNSNNVENMSAMFKEAVKLKKVKMDNMNLEGVKNMNNFFEFCTGLVEFDWSGFNIDNVESMDYFFRGATSLRTINLSGAKFPQLKSMNYFFFGCSGLQELNMSNMNLMRLTNINAIFNGVSNIKKVNFSNTNMASIVGLGSLFLNNKSIEEVDMSYMNLSSTTDMANMFYGCSNLNKLNMTNMNLHNLTNMGGIFAGCDNLKILNFDNTNMGSLLGFGGNLKGATNLEEVYMNGMNLSSLTTLENVFQNLSKLKKVSIKNNDLSSCKKINSMFYNCTSLEDVDIEINDNIIEDTRSVFEGCTGLETIDLKNFNMSHVTSAGSMFKNCTNLKTIDLSGKNLSSITNMDSTFEGCSLLEEVNMSNIKLNSLTSINNIFKNCINLKKINLNNTDMGSLGGFGGNLKLATNLEEINMSGMNLSNVTSLEYLFQGLSKLKKVNMNNIDLSSCTKMNNVFTNCVSLEDVKLDIENNAITTTSSMFEGCTGLETIDLKNFNMSHVTSASNMFKNCTNVKTIDLSGKDLSSTIYMEGTFQGCSSLEELDMSNMKLNSLTNIGNIFYGCDELKTINLSQTNMSKITSISNLFKEKTKIKSINMEGINLSGVTHMEGAFQGCSSLEEVNMSNMNLSSLTNIGNMFLGCAGLKRVDFNNTYAGKLNTLGNLFKNLTALENVNMSGIILPNLMYMNNTFQGCTALTGLDLTTLDTSKVTQMVSLFENASNLRVIYVSDKYSVDNVSNSSNMFNGATSLVGGNGTEYNSSKTNKEYARIDLGDIKGYFTDPRAFTVRFLSGTESISTQTISTGGYATGILDNTKIYSYYTDPELNTPYDFSTPLYAYTEIYTKSIPSIYTITYDAESHSGTINGEPTKEETVAYNATITLPTTGTTNIVSEKPGYVFMGWTDELGGIEPIAGEQTITRNVTYYPIFKKESVQYRALFSGNGATLNGTNATEVTVPCEISAVYNTGVQATTCKLTTPSIQRAGYEIKGYHESKDHKDECTIIGNEEIEIDGNKTYYAIIKKDLTAIFDRNGNTSQTKYGTSISTTEPIEEICSVWNEGTECKVRTPTITTDKTVIGYTTSAISSGENLIGENTELTLATTLPTIPVRYYAWTKSNPTEIKISYSYGTGVVTGTEISGRCIPEVRYNGDETLTGCLIELPAVQARTGYAAAKWYRGDAEVITDAENRAMFYYSELPLTLTAKAEIGDKIAYVVKHYFQILENNTGTNKYQLNGSITDTGLSGEVETVLVLSCLKKQIEGYEYSKATVNGEEVNGVIDIEQAIAYAETHQLTTPVEIKLLYTRNRYQYTLNEDVNVTTEGSTESVNAFYGQEITLSGRVINDCYERSRWQGLPNGVTNTQQTTFSMPASPVTITPEVNEKTYTIVFDANAEDAQGIVEPKNVRCTAEVQLDGSKVYRRDGYLFQNWNTKSDGSGTPYAKDAQITTALTKTGGATVVLYAQWSASGYTVTFDANSGVVTETTKEVIYKQPYGILPTPTREGYEFTGWYTEKVGGTKVTADTQVITATNHTLYAQWEVKNYTITWKNSTGTVLKEELLEYGSTPNYGGTPTSGADAQYTYTFTGWDPAIKTVTEDQVYTAVYDKTVRSYTITWKNENGDIIETTEVEYGETPTHAGPEKVADEQYTYTFAGWTPTVEPVTGEASYTATYSGTIRSYTITWLSSTGVELRKDTLPYGSTPNYGENPTSGSTAEYEYSFKGWTPTVEPVTGETSYTATYNSTKRSYTITWKRDDGTTRGTTQVEYGKVPTYASGAKASTEQTGYNFKGWYPEVVAVTKDATYTEVYEEYLRDYTIVWKDYDGTVIKTGENVPYGTIIVNNKPAQDPNREATAQTGYTFTGWYDEAGVKLTDTKKLTGDISYTARYDEALRKYTIIWNNRNGAELEKDVDVEYGRIPSYDSVEPTSGANAQYTYHFSGWTPLTGEVTGDQVYTATYSQTTNSYPITWKNDDGTEIKTTQVLYGVTPSYTGPTPTKEGYTFKSWNPTLVAVTEATDYTATYTVNSYDVTPVKGVGVAEIVGGGSYAYNTVVTLTGIAKEGYHFEGGVSEKAFTYTVPSHSTTPQIDAEPNTYHVHFKPNGGTGVMANQEFVYDVEQELSPNAYTRSGFTFISWTDGEGGYYTDKKKVKNLATTGSVILLAQWFEGEGPTPGPTPIPTPSGGSGGGGKRIDKETKEHNAAEEKEQTMTGEEIKANTGTINPTIQTGTTEQTPATESTEEKATIQWTEEELTAYQYAYKYGITTLAPEEASRPDEYVQRGHMAKMVVNYAINVLHWKLPAKLPKQCKWKDGRNAWESQEIKEYAEKACALGLMGMDMEYFQPYKLVTRAQFGTIFGRLLWGKLPGKPYYAEHLARLKKRGIMTQIESPEERMEVRKWAWLMFMRSEKYFKGKEK